MFKIKNVTIYFNDENNLSILVLMVLLRQFELENTTIIFFFSKF